VIRAVGGQALYQVLKRDLGSSAVTEFLSWAVRHDDVSLLEQIMDDSGFDTDLLRGIASGARGAVLEWLVNQDISDFGSCGDCGPSIITAEELYLAIEEDNQDLLRRVVLNRYYACEVAGLVIRITRPEQARRFLSACDHYRREA
jgi:hypothetical protein